MKPLFARWACLCPSTLSVHKWCSVTAAVSLLVCSVWYLAIFMNKCFTPALKKLKRIQHLEPVFFAFSKLSVCRWSGFLLFRKLPPMPEFPAFFQYRWDQCGGVHVSEFDLCASEWCYSVGKQVFCECWVCWHWVEQVMLKQIALFKNIKISNASYFSWGN